MFIELDPGTKRRAGAERGLDDADQHTLPDVNPDEFLAGLDADTRDYLKLLHRRREAGASTGRGEDLRDVLKRFEPTYRDLAAVPSEVAKRRARAAPAHPLAQRAQRRARPAATTTSPSSCSASAKVFEALASEKTNVGATIHELPAP